MQLAKYSIGTGDRFGREALAQLGCGIGTYIPSVDFYGICQRFLLENERVSWISVNMVGTTAEVTDAPVTGEDTEGAETFVSQTPKDDDNDPSKAYLTKQGLDKVATGKNIIIFLVDRFEPFFRTS